MTNTHPCRVLIVDDSLSMCKFLEKVLSSDPEVEVVGYALDAYEARDKIKVYKPDVLTLDIEMPKMDGLTFLRNLMRLHPMPVVMISSLTAAGAAVTFDALNEGAVDFMVKRHPGSKDDLRDYAQGIIARVKNAATAKSTFNRITKRVVALPDLSDVRTKFKGGVKLTPEISRIIAIGSSTGGPDALRHLLEGLDVSSCALMFAQHMPKNFMAPFAERLNTWSEFDIKLATPFETIQAGCGYVAPGDQHLELVKQGQEFCCKLTVTEKVEGHRPSVDVLYNSVAKYAANRSVGVLLTGMGEDGARGLTTLRETGALTIVQDEKSSAVWGMPGKAVKLGGADATLGLQQISAALNTVIAEAA